MYCVSLKSIGLGFLIITTVLVAYATYGSHASAKLRANAELAQKHCSQDQIKTISVDGYHCLNDKLAPASL